MSASRTRRDSLPWYKERWTWLLMLMPATAIVAGFITLWLAITSFDGLVADDYYKQGLAINQTLARANAGATGLAVQVVASSVEGYLDGMPRAFDVVWLDPPYDVATRVVEGLVERVADAWLAPDGLVVVERSSRDTPPSWPESLPDQRTRRYGETTLYLASKEDAP